MGTKADVSFIIQRGRRGWDTWQWGLFRNCLLEVRKSYLAPPQPVAIGLCLLASLLRHRPLASEHDLQKGNLTTAIP